VSSHGSDFNFDYHVSFSPEALARGETVYNYTPQKLGSTEMPGISAFLWDGNQMYHSYSTYARELDRFNDAYHYLSITPNVRDAEGLAYPQQWVRHRIVYET